MHYFSPIFACSIVKLLYIFYIVDAATAKYQYLNLKSNIELLQKINYFDMSDNVKKLKIQKNHSDLSHKFDISLLTSIRSAPLNEQFMLRLLNRSI